MSEQRTYTKRLIDPYNLSATDICIQDIAQHLSRICRFNGAMEGFYSVAQHSVHVSAVVPPEMALWGLLHDAAEAYIGDIIEPVKKELGNFRELEKQILYRIIKTFSLDWPMPGRVLSADKTVLEWELADLDRYNSISWAVGCEPAKNLFMSQYRNLTDGECPCGCGLNVKS